MIIKNHRIQNVNRVYQDQNLNRLKQAKPKGAAEDKVSLSAEGLEIQAVMQKVRDADDIRPQVDQIRQSISAGTYRVSEKDVATSILRSFRCEE